MAFRKTLENITDAADELERLNAGVRVFNATAAAGVSASSRFSLPVAPPGADSLPLPPRGADPREAPLSLREFRERRAAGAIVDEFGRLLSPLPDRPDPSTGVIGTVSSSNSGVGGSPLGLDPLAEHRRRHFIVGGGQTTRGRELSQPRGFGGDDGTLGFSGGLGGANLIVQAIGSLEQTVKGLGLAGGTAARNAI